LTKAYVAETRNTTVWLLHFEVTYTALSQLTTSYNNSLHVLLPVSIANVKHVDQVSVYLSVPP